MFFNKLKKIAKAIAERVADKALNAIVKIAFGTDVHETPEPRVHGMAVPEPVEDRRDTDVTELKPATPPEVVVPSAPAVPKPTRACKKCGTPFEPMDPRHKYCRSCSAEYHRKRREELLYPPPPPVSPQHQADELFRASLILAYLDGNLPENVEVKKNGAQVVFKATIERHGVTVRRSFTYTDERIAKQIAEERAARARAAAPARPKSPEQIHKEKLAAAKTDAESSRRAANFAATKARQASEAATLAAITSEAECTVEKLTIAIEALEAEKKAELEAATLEAKAHEAEAKLAELTAPPPASPKKSKKKDKEGKDGDKDAKNGKGGRHARAN